MGYVLGLDVSGTEGSLFRSWNMHTGRMRTLISQLGILRTLTCLSVLRVDRNDSVDPPQPSQMLTVTHQTEDDFKSSL